MAYYNEVAARSGLVERMLDTVARFLSTAAARRAKHRVYTTTLRELSVLTNRDLADLGLHRSELKRVAMEAANKVAH